MNPENQIDLSKLNKPKKQFKFSLPFRKKSSGPDRDHLGQFTSGGGGLRSLKKFNWGRALPLIVIISAVGGFLVFRSFAGTEKKYSWVDCKPSYTETCMNESVEASVSRLYMAILGRPADKSGMNYWSKQALSGRSYQQVADQFLASNEGKRKYGGVDDSEYVKRLYKNVLERDATNDEVQYWTARIQNKQNTRGQVAAMFANSSENMRKKYAAISSNLETVYETSIPYNVSSKEYASFDLTADKQICSGVVRLHPVTKKNTCTITAKESTAGIYEEVITIPGLKLTPGVYYLEIIADAELPNGKTYSSGNIALTEGESNKIVNRESNGWYGRVGRTYFVEADSNNSRKSESSFIINEAGTLENVRLRLFQSGFTKFNADTIKISKVTRMAYKEFLTESELELSGFQDRLLSNRASSNNPTLSYNDARLKSCVVKTTCTASSTVQLPKGKYQFDFNWLHKVGGTVDLNVVRADNSRVVSSREALYADPILEGVSRKTTLPITLNDQGNAASVSFVLDESAKVKLSAVLSPQSVKISNPLIYRFAITADK